MRSGSVEMQKKQKKRENGEGIRFPAVNVLRLLKKKEMGWQKLPVKEKCVLVPFTRFILTLLK